MASKYVDFTFLTARYPDVARIAGAETIIPAWVEPAEAEIEGRLATKYVVPFTSSPAPAMVKDLVADLAYYRMNIKQKWAKDFGADVERRLQAIINGTLTLPGAESTGADTAWCSGTGMASAFGMDDPIKWRVSSNWQDAYPADRDAWD